MADRIAFDYGNMLASRLDGRGVRDADLDAAAAGFAAVHAAIEARRADGTLGFLKLPHERETVGHIRAFGEGPGQAFDTIVVLGIGGSALGATALRTALLRPFWNELDDETREYYPRLYVLDNVDPTTVGALLERLDPARTLFNVVSKSGSTAETMAQFLVVRSWLRSALDDGYRGHFIFTTDPERGVLRRIARDEGIVSLPVPSAVGGRFSVLSSVGLLPAALVGIDIDELLAGAAAMADRCRTDDLRQNPAGLFAVLQHLAQTRAGANVHVMMPYSDRLLGAADWFRQLWAESLGKRLDRGGNEVFTGPTPTVSLGATDQHSQVQLYMEGPFDKTITFLRVANTPDDVNIPSEYPAEPSLAYLGGASLGRLLDAECDATRAALTRRGRMNMTIELPAVTPHAIGELFMLLQIATVYAGELYGVDPLDQPGVELGKELTYGLMGREGYDPPAGLEGDDRFRLA